MDFGHTSIYPFVPEKAKPLSDAILSEDGMTFETHSTDYQSTEALADLVKNHFFFLKVGPELTFRFREAVWALASIEDQLGVDRPSNIRDVIEERMNTNPGYWQPYYSGTDEELQVLKTYSYSDRIRYYWADPKVSASLDRLIETLSAASIPETVISQAFMGLDFGEMPDSPSALIHMQVQRCVSRYFAAAGQKTL